MRIKVLETQTTKEDFVVKGLIGTVWTPDEIAEEHAIINSSGGVPIKLEKGEYEFV